MSGRRELTEYLGFENKRAEFLPSRLLIRPGWSPSPLRRHTMGYFWRRGGPCNPPALPPLRRGLVHRGGVSSLAGLGAFPLLQPSLDRKSTRLNSRHSQISYAVFCL